MTTLTKLQQALLSHAATRETGSLHPAPEDLNVAPNRARKAAGQMVELGFAVEGSVLSTLQPWRFDDEEQIGAFITDAGRAMLPTAAVEAPSPAPEGTKVRTTKADLIVMMMSTADGASVDELITATGWLPHTTRAALTGLKKKGHAVERIGDRGASRYRIGAIA